MALDAANALVTGTITKYTGLYIGDLTTNVTNWTGIDIGNGTQPTGNWALYDTSGFASRISGALVVGSTAGSPTIVQGEIAMPKISASGSAPGTGFAKMEWVCGTSSGTAKLIAYAGTSTMPATVVDNVGSGVSGC